MSDSDRVDRLFGTDPAEAARLAAEVQRLGFDAARLVVDRFAQMFDRFSRDGGGGGGGVQLSNGDGDYRRLQAQAQRALESYLAVWNEFSALTAAFPGVAGNGATAPETLALPDISPGGRSSARLWLHNTTTSAAVDLGVWTTPLINHAGTALDPALLTFTPGQFRRLDPGESAEILVVLRVPSDTPCGTYHGLVLVKHLPDTAFRLSVRISAAMPG